MDNIVDLRLTTNSDRIYDLSLNQNGDLHTIASFDTSILLSIFTDQRADKSEISIPQYRRGWDGDELNDDPNFKRGSKLWLLNQARQTTDVLVRAKEYAYLANKWLIDDNYVTELDITTSFVNEILKIEIKFIRDKSVIDSRIFILWENFGKIEAI